jgi:uncharacterized Zn finger protein (UPF0148 family)
MSERKKKKSTKKNAELIDAHWRKRIDAYDDVRKNELPGVLKQVHLLERVLRNEDVLTDSVVNAVFKQKVLLKNSRRIPKDLSEEERTALLENAKKHTNELRRLKGKDGSKLTTSQTLRIKEFLLERKRWCRSIQDEEEKTDFITRTAPIVAEYLDEMVVLRKQREQEAAERLKNSGNKKKRKHTTVVTAAPNAGSEQVLALLGIKRQRVEKEAPMGTSEKGIGRSADIREWMGVRDTQSRLHEIQERYYRVCGESEAPLMVTLAENDEMCEFCGVPTVVDQKQGAMVCPVCGISRDHLIFNTSVVPYSEKREITSSSSGNYKRIDHLLDWLRKVTARTNVKEEVYEQVWEECQRLNIKVLTNEKTKSLLRRLGLTDQYDNVTTITQELNGVPAAQFSDYQKRVLVQMFLEAQPLFDACPPHIKLRKNFMSYSYTLYQCCYMNGWDEFLPCFPLLQCPENRRRHDRIWRWICENKTEGAVWTFYPTT